jgi:hypothetical protein
VYKIEATDPTEVDYPIEGFNRLEDARQVAIALFKTGNWDRVAIVDDDYNEVKFELLYNQIITNPLLELLIINR